ncbi:MAG: virulence RhuM family protein [candidate division KSB1 bacterium]|nr:virulence RhuM family protein [candidate division KSB1 bacterium]MDZ7367725.1 virulence RhuM family protein [candidate division KSB1 bacterium]MDZ7406309.1 virulence RhuM family protein [candidate division KSB1 bacterium]
MENTSEILLYRTEDGRTEIQVTLQDETVWLSQAQMAELFQKSIPTINEHIKNAYDEGELDEKSTIRKFRIVQTEKKRKVTRTIDFYNLDVIISVGYRVKSHRGTQFRIWATQRLKEYIVKGFVMDDRRLAGGATNYFDELIERVRRIRTSERNFYEKVRDIFATSIDYDPQTDYARQFYATVQNKFHYAIHGRTAAELIAERVDSAKPFMGMTNWSGKIITRKEAEIAKNYLEELELKRLELLVEQFLSFAELRVVEKKPLYMADWVKKLDEFLILNEKEILQHAGKVSHKEMEAKVRDELEKYHEQMQRKQIEAPK